MTSSVDNEPKGLKSRFTDLLENTSAHGLGSIERSGKCGFRKAFWMLVCSFALFMFVLQLYYIAIEYINKDVSISVDIKYSKSLNFPAVTFCNLNPIKLSALKRSDRLNALLGSPSSDSVQTDVTQSSDVPLNIPVTEATDVDGQHSPRDEKTVEILPATRESSEHTGRSLVSGERTDQSTVHTMIKAEPTRGMGVGPASDGEAMMGPPPSGRKKRSNTDTSLEKAGYGNWTAVDYGRKSDDHNLLLQVTDSIAQIPYNERSIFGHQIEDMLLSCTWKGFSCSPDNFTHFFNYKHGNCYTFNSGLNGTYEVSSKTGPLYGLTMELYLEQREYIPDIQQAAGLRLSIHDQQTMPFPEDNGISVQPGTETSAGVRFVKITREPDPYGDCVQPETANSLQNIFSSFFGTQYSLESCEKNCLHENIVASCECADPRFCYNALYPPCMSTNDTQVACQESIEAAYVNEELNCPCTNPCSEEVYALTISSAMWPNDQYKPTIVSQLSDISSTIRESLAQDEDFIEKNVLKLHVYFEHLNYESIEQSPAYTGLDCLSDIGGQIGLWIGFSVITWFEFGEFLFDAFIIICKKLLRNGQHRKTTPTVAEDALSKERPIRPVFEMDRARTINDIVVN